MADVTEPSPLAALRRRVVACREALRLAQVRETEAAKACSAPCRGDDETLRAVLEAARRERQAADEAHEEALAELKNAVEDEREANDDDPIGPQTDYSIREIVAKLSHHHQRATYAAVGGLLRAPEHWVRQWFSGKETVDDSFIVSAQTLKPTRYPRHCIHPSLTRRLEVLRTTEDLLRWLQRHPLLMR